jgi:hypothetical protein
MGYGRFGVREICDVVFKAKSDVKIGTSTFKKGQPVLYIDSAKTSTVEGAATTVYAQGGKGNTRLIAWEGEKTLTFTVEDALLSPIGFSILSGAGLFKSPDAEVHVHTTATAMTSSNEIDLTDALGTDEKICTTAPIFVVETESDGSITGNLLTDLTVDATGKKLTGTVEAGKAVFVDFYIVKKSANISELQIDAENFAGYYYVEASTLFRRQVDGVDMPAELTLPNVKIQSNFTFTMASTGDPSTFTFTMDAMPGYTYFDKTKKVLCVIQVVEDATGSETELKSVMEHRADEKVDESTEDSLKAIPVTLAVAPVINEIEVEAAEAGNPVSIVLATPPQGNPDVLKYTVSPSEVTAPAAGEDEIVPVTISYTIDSESENLEENVNYVAPAPTVIDVLISTAE